MTRLFFLPGAGADPGFWRPLGDLLPAAWEKVYFGWPGLGAQARAPGIDSLDDLIGMVAAEIGDEPVELLAQSMGGLVAMTLALRHPKQVRRMVLSVTSGGIDVAALGGANWRGNYRANFPAAADWMSAAREDLTPRLAEITAPVLLLWGDADPISPVAVGERLRGLLPDARLEVVAGGDHDLVATHAARLGPMVENFLSSDAPLLGELARSA